LKREDTVLRIGFNHDAATRHAFGLIVAALVTKVAQVDEVARVESVIEARGKKRRDYLGRKVSLAK
jgi:hypothetical protein